MCGETPKVHRKSYVFIKYLCRCGQGGIIERYM